MHFFKRSKNGYALYVYMSAQPLPIGAPVWVKTLQR